MDAFNFSTHQSPMKVAGLLSIVSNIFILNLKLISQSGRHSKNVICISVSKSRIFLWIFHTPSSATPIHIQCCRYLKVSCFSLVIAWTVQSSKPLGSMQMGITIRAFPGFQIITVIYIPSPKGWYLISQAFPALLPTNVLMPTHHQHIIKYLMADEAVIQVACENLVGSGAIRADKTFLVSL